jgi:hypothetical protein
MNTPSTKTRCPVCNSRGTPIKGGKLKCKKCGGEFDATPNEHGRALHRDPIRNAEMMEREAASSFFNKSRKKD